MLAADWEECGTKKSLEKQIGNDFKVFLGWTETKTDTMLCVEVPSKLGEPRYNVYCWNQTGVRAKLAGLLGLPVSSG